MVNPCTPPTPISLCIDEVRINKMSSSICKTIKCYIWIAFIIMGKLDKVFTQLCVCVCAFFWHRNNILSRNCDIRLLNMLFLTANEYEAHHLTCIPHFVSNFLLFNFLWRFHGIDFKLFYSISFESCVHVSLLLVLFKAVPQRTKSIKLIAMFQ